MNNRSLCENPPISEAEMRTMRDWMYYDDDNDGINDIAYQTWVDSNKNNVQDKNEPRVGDFQELTRGCCYQGPVLTHSSFSMLHS